MKRFLPLLLLLAACATPREQCMTSATGELRVMDALIEETEANIARGYAIRRDVEPTMRLRFCTSPNRNVHFCNTHATRLVERPEPIDLNAEQRKLRSLQQRRREMERSARRAIAACAARYPA
ncbi:hypothetical protein [Aliiroseovarius sp. YM-037]|uniref:hypothetical protein n=1 Tax=Aliiroseovarius sp. YM-037 TaxID=3341728 RepID=UPI003A7FA9CB